MAHVVDLTNDPAEHSKKDNMKWKPKYHLESLEMKHLVKKYNNCGRLYVRISNIMFFDEIAKVLEPEEPPLSHQIRVGFIYDLLEKLREELEIHESGVTIDPRLKKFWSEHKKPYSDFLEQHSKVYSFEFSQYDTQTKKIISKKIIKDLLTKEKFGERRDQDIRTRPDITNGSNPNSQRRNGR